MDFRHLRCLAAPNGWAPCPVFEAALDFSDESSWTDERIRQTVDRLGAELLAESGSGLPSRTKSPPAGWTYLAEAFARAALNLQKLSGISVTFVATRETAQPGLVLAAVEFVAAEVGQAVMETALKLLQAAAANQPLPLAAELERMLDLARDQFPPLSASMGRLRVRTFDIYQAARARNIPIAMLSPGYWGCHRLGQGSKHHRLRASEPDTVSAVARMASTDKNLAKQMLAAQGVPVPKGKLVSTADEAWAAACELELPVAVKPVDTDLAIGVSLDLRSREQVERAFNEAAKHGPEVLVEQFAPGVEHRVLVVGNRVAAVTRIEPPHVMGDGVSTIAQLAERVNLDPRRGEEDSGGPLYKLKLDEVAREVLAGQGLAFDSVPEAGQKVLVRRNPPYIKHGGFPLDLTDRIHPINAAHAVAAAQAMQIPLAGLDVVAVDIGRPLEEQRGVVVEINTGPAFWLHLAPYADSPRPVGKDLIDLLFPPGNDGRIPVVAVVGDASGAATKHLMSLLARSGLRAASAAEQEINVGGRRYVPHGKTPQLRATALFQNETVDVAILKTTPRELVCAGFGNDRCDVALVLDPSAAAKATDDEPGHPPGEYMQALRNALSSDGILVLPAEQPAPEIKPPMPAKRVVLFAGRKSVPRLTEHLLAGGRGIYAQDAGLVLSQGIQTPIPLGKRPTGISEQELPALLAPLAAALALGQSVEALKDYLGSLS